MLGELIDQCVCRYAGGKGRNSDGIHSNALDVFQGALFLHECTHLPQLTED